MLAYFGRMAQIKKDFFNVDSLVRTYSYSDQLKNYLRRPFKSKYQRLRCGADWSYSQPSSSQPLQHHGKAGQVSVGQVNLVSSPDCQNNSTFPSGFQHCLSEPCCWELWHRGVEKQLNQTWVSSCRTNASSAFFSSARDKLVCFLYFFFLKKGHWMKEYWKWKRKPSKRELRHFVSPGDQCWS